MSRARLWTDEEIKKLELLYLSGKAIEEIMNDFQERSANAIRQKASRLGLRRPLISPSFIKSQKVLRCSNGNRETEEFLFRCSDCGNWIHVNLSDEEKEDRFIVCRQCQNSYRYVT